MERDAVREWASSRGLIARGAAESTHLLLNGGKLALGEAAEAEFLETYARWLAEGRKTFVVERRTTAFRFFVDVDYVSRLRPGTGDLGTIAEVAARIVGSALVPALSDVDFHASVSSQPKVIEREGEARFKRGLHVVFPDVLVDANGALELRRHLVRGLGDAFGDMDWDAVVDRSVYSGAGLRLIGSRKASRCDCASGCRTCGFTKFKALDDVYVPLRRYADFLEMVQKNSIREPASSGRARAEVAPFEPDDEERPQAPKPGGANGSEVRALDCLSEDLRAAFPRCFDSGQQLTRVYSAGDHLIANSSSRFCYNLGRSHRSNNVYFYVDNRRMYQRCYCTCPTSQGRRQGECSQFRHPGGPPSERTILEMALEEPDPRPSGRFRKGEVPEIQNLHLMPRAMAERMMVR